VTQSDGQILAVDGGDDIKLWQNLQSPPEWQWGDVLNDGASIRDIAAGDSCSVFGTRRGHVFLLTSDRRVCQLNKGPRSVSGTDTADEITRVAFDGSRWAVSGNRRGEILLFDVTRIGSDDMAERCRIAAHTGPTNSVAITSDGMMIASGGEDGVVRFWHREGDQLVLWTEWDNFANPLQQLEFSPDDSRLYVACREERGLRILQMNKLDRLYRDYGCLTDALGE